MKILKFGGTSVGNAERFKNLLSIIKSKDPLFIVLSAMSGTTDQLIKLSELLIEGNKYDATLIIDKMEIGYKKVVSELYSDNVIQAKAAEMVQANFDYLRNFTTDVFTILEEKAILALGELISTSLFQLLCEEHGLKSILIPALNFMKLDINEEPDFEYIKCEITKLLERNKDYDIYITQGYICRNSFGEIDNLKRGGSDYTATLIGAALNADEIQIWTDIDGLHNNDPRYVENTLPVDQLSFDEAAELAYFGAKILHPTCVLPAKNANIPVRLLNTLNPASNGTVISNNALTTTTFKAIAAKDGIIAINIISARMLLAYGFLRAVFEVFERFKTPIDMITTSEVAVSLTIDNDKFLEDIVIELMEFGIVNIEKDQTIVCIVGNNLNEKSGYAARIFDSLIDIPLRMISFGGSNSNVSLLVKTKYKKLTLERLHEGLFIKSKF